MRTIDIEPLWAYRQSLRKCMVLEEIQGYCPKKRGQPGLESAQIIMQMMDNFENSAFSAVQLSLLSFRTILQTFWVSIYRQKNFVASSGNMTDEVIMEYIKNQDIEENQKPDNFTIENF